MEVRLRRSVLFTPGTAGERITKALARAEADVVVADLEDAVPPEAKVDARAAVHDALEARTPGGRPEAWVRVNAWTSGLVADDVAAVMPARPDVLVLPKAERLAHVETLDVLVARAEARAGIDPGSTGIMLLIETAAGVLAVDRLVRASPRITAVAFGAEDLAADAGLKRTKAAVEVLHARSRVALAAATVGADAVDQVFVDLDDVDGIGDEARIARTLGYTGKMVLHPRQIAPVHAAFQPSAEELQAARRLVAAADAEGASAGGVLRFEGRMIDVPLIAQARRVLARAEAAEGRPRADAPAPRRRAP